MSLFQTSIDPGVSQLVERCGYATAALTVLPIPGSEIIGVMPLHVGMVVGVAHHYGKDLTTETATELLLQIGATVGASLVGSRIATTAAKFVLPGLGGLIAAPFMFASTLAIGAVADQWFRNDGAVSDSAMRDLYKKTMQSAKSSFRPSKMKQQGAMSDARTAVERSGEGSPGEPPASAIAGTGRDLTARLRQAKDMLDAGLVDQAEFDALKARILEEV